jgi:hypothetical protein
VGRLRGWLGRVERAAEGDLIAIPQRGGTVRRFSSEELAEAYTSAYRLALGQGGEPHPMLEAMRNSTDARWRSMWDDLHTTDRTRPTTDLSE